MVVDLLFFLLCVGRPRVARGAKQNNRVVGGGQNNQPFIIVIVGASTCIGVNHPPGLLDYYDYSESFVTLATITWAVPLVRDYY